MILATHSPKILDDTRWKRTRDSAALNRRIETLGQLDERHKLALGQGNRQALLELAAEYLMVGNHGGCPGIARVITFEAESL